MGALPFVIQPKRKPVLVEIGNEDTGMFTIERRGYLTVAEKSFVQAALSEDTTMSKFYSLIGQISKETKQPMEKIVEDVKNGEMTKYKKWEEKLYTGVQSMNNFLEIQKIVIATAMISCRIDPEWTAEDTMKQLHPDLLEVLKDLYEKEDNRSQDALISVAEAFEEEEIEGNEEVKE